MNKKCPKCGYERNPTDLTSEHECPKCGVIYEKYDKALHSSSTQEEDKKRCPYCGEQILSVAIKCKHCGEYLTNKPGIVTKRGLKQRLWNIPHRNLKIAVLSFFILLGSVFLYFTPHLAVHSMKRAAELNDAERLSDYVDYPSLRESLKATVSAALADKVARSPNSSFGDAIGAGLAVAFINPIINSLVTPESLATLMKRHSNKDDRLALPEVSSKKHSPQERVHDDISMGYRGFNQFVVKFQGKSISEEPVQFIFKRKGILSWKLSALRLPQNAFSGFSGSQGNEATSTVGRVSLSRQKTAKLMIALFETALDTYKLDIGRYPTTTQGLKALRERPNGVQRWDGPYLPKDIPMDPWGNPYQYHSSAHSDCNVISYGADGKPGGEAEDADVILQ
ncbi:MAG: type II secretion system major pseudopilin GspG [Desulfobacteraceae bacterium]|nr:type II secretion system major pseudopilin GspG [Desulfobacteraceae bacterium]